MIVTSNTAVQNKPTKSVSTTERVMASTMSVDEYFDELIDKVIKEPSPDLKHRPRIGGEK